ncbi:MAG TPA: hypothetical protein VNL92_05980 [Dehalococcoidia bacterium]|nr:hypothetical protein [Dehalococcoidia bacterium]
MASLARFSEWSRKAALLGALLVPASAAAALAVHAWRAAEVPDLGDWTRAAAAVRSQFRAGDLIAFAPGWAQEGRGLFRGLDVLPQERWSRDDIARARRLFVVSSFDGRTPAWLSDVGREEAREDVGGIVVRRFELLFPRALTDFRALGPVEVSLDATPCTRSGERWDCTQSGRFPWRWVGPQFMQIGGRARSCIYAHPTTRARLRIAFPPATLGSRLLIGHGLSDAVAGRGASVTLGVSVAGEPISSLEHGQERGWRADSVDTSRWRGRSERVEFTVTTDNDGARHFCFTAEALE